MFVDLTFFCFYDFSFIELLRENRVVETKNSRKVSFNKS